MNSLKNELQENYKKKKFWQFDNYMVYLMLQQENTNLRKEALKEFRKRTNNYPFASYPTIQKWFGINGYAKPGRMQIFEMAFVLHLDGNVVNDMLTRGLQEPMIQVNDYQEAICLYGLEHGLSWEETQAMIGEFHKNMEQNISIRHSQSTSDLLREFQLKKNLSKESFLEWMAANAEAFKGYSNTTLNYLKKYKRIIWKNLRMDAKSCLEEQLLDTDYAVWREKQHFLRKTEGEWIRKFIYKTDSLPQKTRKEILDLTSLVYFEEETNVRVLAEIFSTLEPKRNSQGQSLRFMTEKYLSDLLNIATQKERDIRTAQLEVWLEEFSDTEPCPKWMMDIVKECDISVKTDKTTIFEVKEWVKRYRKEHKRRLVQIDRSDLLPMIHYVAQNQYMKTVESNEDSYDKEAAKQYFIELADQTLSACCMARFSENYEMDYVLSSCFQEEECFSYSDALNIIIKMDRISF